MSSSWLMTAILQRANQTGKKQYDIDTFNQVSFHLKPLKSPNFNVIYDREANIHITQNNKTKKHI